MNRRWWKIETQRRREALLDAVRNRARRDAEVSLYRNDYPRSDLRAIYDLAYHDWVGHDRRNRDAQV